MTTDLKIPANYQALMPYLIIKDAESFIAFTKEVFGAIVLQKVMRDETTVMHGEVMINGCTIMFADATEEYHPNTAGMFVYVQDANETYKMALDKGAKAVTPLSDQSYGRSGGVEDPFGNTWWITSVIA